MVTGAPIKGQQRGSFIGERDFFIPLLGLETILLD